MLIIWDRLFGSFEKEIETPRYGTITPLKNYNLLWINTHGGHEVWHAIGRQHSLRAKLRCVFASPNMGN